MAAICHAGMVGFSSASGFSTTAASGTPSPPSPTSDAAASLSPAIVTRLAGAAPDVRDPLRCGGCTVAAEVIELRRMLLRHGDTWRRLRAAVNTKLRQK